MFINPRQVGIAFLAKTLYLRAESVNVRPRLQPLHVPPGASLIAVVRIEPDRSVAPLWSANQREQAVNAIREVAKLPHIAGVQIDFDASKSERAFYQELLKNLRKSLNRSIPISITALASWCIYDDWISALPIDEAVPMLFRMGADHRQVLMYLSRHKDFPVSRCQTTVGVSVDEPWVKLPAGRRTYVFNPTPWSETTVGALLSEVRR